VKNLATAERWKAIATEERGAADNDTIRARTLLAALTDDIAPLARLEIADINALAAVEAAKLAKDKAARELGVENTAATDAPSNATGAQAVLEAALATKANVQAQQAFHNARAKWAFDNLAPVKKQLDDLKDAKAGVDALVELAKMRLVGATAACKVAAFNEAQDALEKAEEFEAARADKAAEVERAYSALAEFATDGSANTLCNEPPLDADGAQGPRPFGLACKEPEEDGDPVLCCGAAQRFLKDGTKLTIETC